MMDERQMVIDAFGRHFEAFKNKKLILYGIGKNTRYILEHYSQHDFVGLMDEVRTGEIIYGKNIISLEQVLESGADTIIIVARANNVRIIFRRIADFCAENSISVYDLNGNLLTEENRAVKSFDQYLATSMTALQDKILNTDVVSFDIFDTLVMRKTLHPQDIFLIAEEKIGRRADGNGVFAKTRAKAEQELYIEGKNPNIDDIYDRIQQILRLADETIRSWKQFEIKTEEEFIIPRTEMIEAYHYAKAAGKEIYLVSDMYLPRSIICPLLSGFGVKVKADHILISCDYGVSKSNGLFHVLRRKAGNKKILHIGDDPDADNRFAGQYGIDDVFPVKTAIAMLEDSHASELLEYGGTLCNRMMIGEFIGSQLNNPFLFNRSRGKFVVKSNYDIGYSYLAPMICSFIGWMACKSEELKLEYILFSARDGYILEKISRALCGEIPNFPKTHYFYTSRAAAVLAGLHSDQDILYAARLAYAGSAEEMLRSRFLLETDEIQEWGGCSDDDFVLKHRDAIMKHAKIAKKNYLAYLDNLQIRKGARVGFVDFVSSGTCQKGLSAIAGFDLYGLYFVHLYDAYKGDMKIEAMYGAAYPGREVCHLSENYFFMENILASFEPTLQSFDESGTPVFYPEKRTDKQLDALKDIHHGIIDYVRHTKLDLGSFAAVNNALPDLLFHFLQDQYSEKATDNFETEFYEDEFCNRKFKIGILA